MIENLIDWADDGRKRERDFDKLEGIMVHRCGVDLQTGIVLGHEPKSIIREFCGFKGAQYPTVAGVTGGENAYSIYIGGDLGAEEYDGKVWQALPLDEVGFHGRRFSVPYLGIGLIADPRYRALSRKQYEALVDLCAGLCAAWLWDPYSKIKGHGEVPGAHGGNKAPGQSGACPGDLLVMNHLRDDVALIMKDTARRSLLAQGLVFS